MPTYCHIDSTDVIENDYTKRYERLNDPGHSILVRKSYNFARYLNLTFTDLENIANLLFKN
jgi:hypothetical protein